MDLFAFTRPYVSEGDFPSSTAEPKEDISSESQSQPCYSFCPMNAILCKESRFRTITSNEYGLLGCIMRCESWTISQILFDSKFLFRKVVWLKIKIVDYAIPVQCSSYSCTFTDKKEILATIPVQCGCQFPGHVTITKQKFD